MSVHKLKVGMAGLGRVGKIHVINLLHHTPRAELVAAFSPDPAEIAWGRQNLEPYGVTLYDNYDKMLEHPGLAAVAIGTATSVHAEQTIKAIDRDLHVLCEKPLSTDIEVCKAVVQKAKTKPHLKVMCGFSRRFDESYREVHDKISQGLIGRPSIIRSQTCDKFDPSGFYVAYAAWSGGVFVDMSVHDIDLTLWFFGDDSVPKSISAHGITAVQPELKKYNDYDNAEDTTEVIGTEGKLSVNTNPQRNFVNFYHSGGITREVPSNFIGRFGAAFVKEANEFTAACLDNTPLPIKLTNAVKAVEIGAYLQEALVTGKQIHFDEIGRRIEKPML
ncbi:NAD-binding Rossmann fold oxidoreductase family protein [Aspergillus nomiae NRRL 13137]|uniref:NAD-binding Rossmann fold oxidoreductase family protein n=1 Tax=Aspergillus nomiae NRRL (strain ATCC 15546 / NRRL 13137 / CBS 260.88 / M93) TaxID=1509407 RepID=A0A0L1J123_ASPN3|nr:NAD-binding Rossmann fold oxidoreductase family protein [Aspergillus nomiae NRRL 13137]KNG85370.1 NAD-binding Rossmann fold oxidoreductase family protein [Aspergillus nomiae NRRL 13137]